MIVISTEPVPVSRVSHFWPNTNQRISAQLTKIKIEYSHCHLLLFFVFYIYLCIFNIYIFLHNLKFIHFRMQRFGSSNLHDWDRGNAYYSRLTLTSSTGLSRPREHYPNLNLPNRPSVVNSPLSQFGLYRTELLDMGQIFTYFELCKFFTLFTNHKYRFNFKFKPYFCIEQLKFKCILRLSKLNNYCSHKWIDIKINF